MTRLRAFWPERTALRYHTGRSRLRCVRLAVLVSGLVGLLVLVFALPASAKMPPFDYTVHVDGKTATVTVTVSGFDDETPPEGFDPSDLNGLLAIYPHDHTDRHGRPAIETDVVPVNLERIEVGRYQAQVTLERNLWSVVPFPNVSSYDPDAPENSAYPRTKPFSIEENIGLPTLFGRFDLSDFTQSWIKIGPFVGLVAVAAAVYLGVVAVVIFLARRMLSLQPGRTVAGIGAISVLFLGLLWFYAATASHLMSRRELFERIPYQQVWELVGLLVVYALTVGVAWGAGRRLMGRSGAGFTTGAMLTFMLLTFPVVDGIVLDCLVQANFDFVILCPD